MTVEDLLAALDANDIKARVSALAWATGQGAPGAARLAEVLRHGGASVRARAWAMIGIADIGPMAADIARPALFAVLADVSPTMRRRAITTLASLRDVASREAIAALLSDDTYDPSAWFDDDCTVAQAARAALATLDGLGR